LKAALYTLGSSTAIVFMRYSTHCFSVLKSWSLQDREAALFYRVLY